MFFTIIVILLNFPLKNLVTNSTFVVVFREVIPVEEFHKIPPRNFRNMTCTTIREVNSRNNSGSENEFEDGILQENKTLTLEEEETQDPLTWIDADSFGSVFTHHGSSMFLRLGALSENLLVILQMIFKISLKSFVCSFWTR